MFRLRGFAQSGGSGGLVTGQFEDQGTDAATTRGRQSHVRGLKGWLKLVALGVLFTELAVILAGLIFPSSATSIGAISGVVAGTYLAGRLTGLAGARNWVLAGFLVFVATAALNLVIISLLFGQGPPAQ